MATAQFFSQFGEDRILHDLFDGKSIGCCVEIGGNDGVLNSNSLHFEQLGWKTIVIEPIPALCTSIRARRPGAVVVECAVSDRQGNCDFHIAVGVDGMSSMVDDERHRKDIHREGGSIETISVPMRTLDDVLAAEAVMAIDFMTIDVEGAEMRVLAGLTLERWKPRILIIEDNSHGSDPSIVGYLRTRGYENFHRTGVNDWFAAAGDQALLGRFDRAAFARLRAWLPWRYRAGRIAKAILPAFLRARLKWLFGQIPFSPSDSR